MAVLGWERRRAYERMVSNPIRSATCCPVSHYPSSSDIYQFLVLSVFVQLQHWKMDTPMVRVLWWKPIRIWWSGRFARDSFTCWPFDRTRNPNSFLDYTKVKSFSASNLIVWLTWNMTLVSLLCVTSSPSFSFLSSWFRGSQGKGQETDYERLVCHRLDEGSSVPPGAAYLERRARRLAILHGQGEANPQKV